MPDFTAEEMRKAFRAIPKQQRDTHQSFAIRVWRGLSWLERSERAGEIEDQFIALWIAFNSLYGRVDNDNQPWGDREAMGAFLAAIWDLDDRGLFGSLLNRNRTTVLSMCNSKFLNRQFWADPGGNHGRDIDEVVKKLLPLFGTHRMRPVLRALFDALYIMRNQVFHGASTKGSALNRKTLSQSANLLAKLLPSMIDMLIRNGIEHDWGEVCFPPVK